MFPIRFSPPLSAIAVLVLLLAGCAGSGETVRRGASPWRDGIPAHELYKTALMHYACLPRLRYTWSAGDDPIPFMVLDTIVQRDPGVGIGRVDTTSNPLLSGSGGRDTFLPTLGTARRAQIAVACMPIDSISDSSRYLVGFYLLRNYERTERYEDLVEMGETPPSFTVAVNRAGMVMRLAKHEEHPFDVTLGPNQIGTYISVRDYLATKEIIKGACRFTGDTLPLRVSSVLGYSIVCDIDDLNDIDGYTAWHDSTHLSVMKPDFAILAEASISGCGEVRDTLLHALSTAHGRSAPLLEFSAIDAGHLPGYRMLEAFIYKASSSEPVCHVCRDAEWEEFMILDQQNRVLFAVGCPGGCGEE